MDSVPLPSYHLLFQAALSLCTWPEPGLVFISPRIHDPRCGGACLVSDADVSECTRHRMLRKQIESPEAMGFYWSFSVFTRRLSPGGGGSAVLSSCSPRTPLSGTLHGSIAFCPSPVHLPSGSLSLSPLCCALGQGDLPYQVNFTGPPGAG